MSVSEDVHACLDLAVELDEALTHAEKAVRAIEREVAKAFRKDAKAQKNKGA